MHDCRETRLQHWLLLTLRLGSLLAIATASPCKDALRSPSVPAGLYANSTCAAVGIAIDRSGSPTTINQQQQRSNAPTINLKNLEVN
ncbi:hypothetical protein NIES4075_02200 [Tolypothrix sp. NIES-4075]|uniref:hypothetical protein n=1 Tax=Tolypothrix sp. NIES-4075 TaxID=2005459 RepID=UPI000B5C1E17|nr:hypothetical protein [Tolypothrix sp. NIES-4075]GAX39269.1 hypothetical protein NIES4075_02200 [Tolypothrix sp. NIES-4075]